MISRPAIRWEAWRNTIPGIAVDRAIVAPGRAHEPRISQVVQRSVAPGNGTPGVRARRDAGDCLPDVEGPVLRLRRPGDDRGHRAQVRGRRDAGLLRGQRGRRELV